MPDVSRGRMSLLLHPVVFVSVASVTLLHQRQRLVEEDEFLKTLRFIEILQSAVLRVTQQVSSCSDNYVAWRFLVQVCLVTLAKLA